MVYMRNETKLDRYYNIVKILLTLSLFVGLAYISMSFSKAGGDIEIALGQNPSMAVMFLVCMINPFIAYLLMIMHRRLNERDGSYAIVNLVFLIVAEAINENLIYILLLGFILYQTMRTTGTGIREGFREKWRNHFLGDISGSLVVIVLSAICLFARIRIGM